MNANPDKPNWRDAPVWALFLAQDGDGYWYWHETDPWINHSTRTWESIGIQKKAGHSPPHDWKNTLEAK